MDVNVYITIAKDHLKKTYWALLSSVISSLNGSDVRIDGSKIVNCKLVVQSKDESLKKINVRLENCSGLPNNTYDVKFLVDTDGIPYYEDSNGAQSIISVIEPDKGKICFNTGSSSKTCITKPNDNCCSFAGSLSCDEINQVLARVNAIRDEVGVPHLSWDCSLAEGSQSWAVELSKKGTLEHSRGNYGENLYWSSTSNSTVIDGVNAWYAEKPNFVYGKSDWCKNGTVCGHYTQLIWEDTKYIGCGIVRGSGGTYVVCRFYPPGNVIGQQPY